MSGPVLVGIGGRRWRLVAEWSGHGATIPAGFETDLASIPPLAEALLRMHRNELHWIVAGIVHDYRYSTQTGPRLDADDELRRIALAERAPRWQASIVWAAVRLFGWPTWIRRRRALRRRGRV